MRSDGIYLNMLNERGDGCSAWAVPAEREPLTPGLGSPPGFLEFGAVSRRLPYFDGLSFHCLRLSAMTFMVAVVAWFRLV
jgi:hypothetical protein